MQGSVHRLSTTNAHFPSKLYYNFSPLLRPRNLHFPHLPSSKTSIISLPPKPSNSPETLSASPATPLPPNSKFHEKLLYLDSLGIDLLSLLTTHPPIVSASIADIKSTISFLRSVGLNAQDLRRAIGMCPEVLTASLSNIVPVFTFLLREAKVNYQDFRRIIYRRPRLLACSVQTRLRPTLYFLQGTIGLAEANRHTHLLSCSVEEKFIPRIEYFQNLGFSYSDTVSMFRRFPSLFCYSIKENLEPKFNYFVVEMGRDLKELKEFPQYFSFSLENRIKPRHRHCVEKGVCLSLPAMLKSSNQLFWDRLEVCCSSSMPFCWCTAVGYIPVNNSHRRKQARLDNQCNQGISPTYPYPCSIFGQGFFNPKGCSGTWGCIQDPVGGGGRGGRGGERT